MFKDFPIKSSSCAKKTFTSKDAEIACEAMMLVRIDGAGTDGKSKMAMPKLSKVMFVFRGYPSGVSLI